MTTEELHQLLDPEVQELIHRHAGDDPAAFAMKSHDRKDLPVRAIAEQIACRRKALKKLPELSRRNLLYTALSLEQASGENTASWKARELGITGKKLMDMSGGLGVDAIFFSRRFDEVVYVERDEALAKIASHNFRELGIGNITVIHDDSTAVLETCPDDSFDWIYADPARREKGRRSVALETASPDVVALHDLLLRKAGRLCIKASPVLELSVLGEKLPSLSTVIVLSANRECREALLICERERQQDASAIVKAVCLSNGVETVVSSEAETESRKMIADSIGEYFYEPDPAIIKARLTAVLADRHGLRFINPAVDYLTSGRKIERFPGRMFRVTASLPYKQKAFKAFLEKQGITAASIQRRDFPLSPEMIRRKFRLQESDRVFLFFSRDPSGQLLCICCKRLS